MVKRKRSLPLNTIEEKPANGSFPAEMSREAVVLTPSISCGTRSRPQSNNAQPSNVSTSTKPEEPVTSTPAEVFVKVGPRTSARVSKRVNREVASATVLASQPVGPKKAAKQLTDKCSSESKTRRSWELWSAHDTDAFYEALCEYGKDFENIQLYIAQRNKRKNGPPGLMSKNTSSSVLTKNKDQVRHFYYRTWHKICKYLEFGDDVKKQTQELYGLINFGEMRKKLGISSVTDKLSVKFKELILNGTTSIKFKGKKHRLKTPVCRALKKLNNIEDCKEPESNPLPKEVCVELRPANNAAFARVQSLAQNPNLRTRIAYNKRLSALFTYLEKRWKSTRLKHRDHVLSSLGKKCEETGAEPILRLRVVGHSKSSVGTLSVAPVESSAWSGDLSLQSHMARMENTDNSDKKRSKKHGGGISTNSTENKVSGEEARDASKDDPKVVQNEESTDPETQAQRSLSLLKTMMNDCESNHAEKELDGITTSASTTKSPSSTTVTESKTDSPDVCSSSPAVIQSVPSKLDAYLTSESSRASLGSEESRTRLTLGQLLGGMANSSANEEEEEIDEDHQHMDNLNDSPVRGAEIVNNGDMDHSPVCGPEFPNSEDLDQLWTKGWTLATSLSLTFGEICLMLDLPEKLILEYDWECPEPVAQSLESPEQVTGDKAKEMASWLSQVLCRLLSVSSTYFSDFKGKQVPNVSPAHRTSRASQNAGPNSSCQANPSNSSCSLAGSMTPPSSKASRRPTLRTQRLPNKTNLANGFLDSSSSQQQQPQIDDQHVFVVPMGAAPRVNKTNPSLESVKDQLDRLVPARHRNQRGGRRKPLVVQRPLLPRRTALQGQGSPMTLVHLLPTSSARTLVLPSGAPTTVQIATNACSSNATSLSFLPSSPASSVPVVVAAPPTATSAALVAEPLHLAAPDSSSTPPSSLVTTTTIQPHTEGIAGIRMLEPAMAEGLRDPPVQISISEHSQSILDISLQGLSDVSQPQPSSSSLLDFGENSNSSLTGAFGLSSSQRNLTANLDPMVSARPLLVHTSIATTSVVSSTTTTPPHSPNGRFKVVSPGPDTQWLNGEGGEFSLSSLLGTLDSPLKNPSNPSQPTVTNNNSLDSASSLEARLGPDVENHLHCLINENSVDYVAKFADLAAQISNTESKCA